MGAVAWRDGYVPDELLAVVPRAESVSALMRLLEVFGWKVAKPSARELIARKHKHVVSLRLLDSGWSSKTAKRSRVPTTGMVGVDGLSEPVESSELVEVGRRGDVPAEIVAHLGSLLSLSRLGRFLRADGWEVMVWANGRWEYSAKNGHELRVRKGGVIVNIVHGIREPRVEGGSVLWLLSAVQARQTTRQVPAGPVTTPCSLPVSTPSGAKDKPKSPLDLVHQRALDATGQQAVCMRCRHFEPGASAEACAQGVGSCALRPGEPQFRFGVCLEWQRMPGSVVPGVGF